MKRKLWKNVPDDDLFEPHLFVADPGQGVMRIDKFLTEKVHKVTRSRVQNAIKAGFVTVNEEEVKPNYKVRPNDRIIFRMPRPIDEAVTLEAQDIPLDIVYEDEHLLVVHKPAGMVVHPGVGNWQGTLVNALMHHYQGQSLPVMEGNPENRPGLVHRIDKDTSGLLVIGKTEDAIYKLARQFFDHTVHRRYVAIVWGEPEEEEGTIESFIGRHPKFRTKMTVADDERDGKWSVTHWKMLEPLYYVSLVEMRLETGRTHQIRVHMMHKGHPLFNDEKYGGDRIRKGTVFSKYQQFVDNLFKILPRQALHAKELGFVHPATGEEMMFVSELPEEFEKCLERWRTYVSDRKSKLNLAD